MAQSVFPTLITPKFIPVYWKGTNTSNGTFNNLTVKGTYNNITISQPIGLFDTSTTTSSNNLLIGKNSYTSSSPSSYDNLMLGNYKANNYTVSGNNNCLIGSYGFGNLTSGSDNVALGNGVGAGLTTGTYNTFVGHECLLYLSTGNYNSCLGVNTGLTLTTGSNNTFLGGFADTLVAGVSNSTAVGTGAKITASNQVVLGTSSETVKIPGSLSIKGTQAITGMVCGVAPPGSATGSVSFGYTFANTPNVTATIYSSNTTVVFGINITSISTTGFTFYRSFIPITGGTGGGAGDGFFWIAMGT